jgi:SAM-dependent methyltransferase
MSLPRLPTLGKGALSFVFPRFRTVHGYDNPLGTVSAESCYSIFLRHLTLLRRAGITGIPPVVAELGPGSSIGVGIAALLAGAQRYYSLDVVDFTDLKSDIDVLDELASFFRRRAPIPASGIHSRRFPDLDNYDWPDWLDLGPSQQWEERVTAIRKDVAARSDRFLKIAAPWTAARVDACVDWIISQSVLEHVDALQDAYVAMARWLKPGGHASHLIDFSSHGMTKEWNGHWAIDDLTWHIMRGKRPYLLNRRPYTDHLTIAAECGLAPVAEIRNKRFDGLISDDFAPRFRKISDDDARAQMVFVILRNKG